jgi:tRNA nucleotidyltransferase/poly(A) polymerase
LAIGESFGVISVRGSRAAGQIDVATFREDGVYSDGRHPDVVRFSTPEKDAQRRDFTINGLFYDPIHNRVLDFVGGQADLQAKVIRAIGDAESRFAEDRLRMLRAIRFAAQFEFQIEPQTMEAIRQAAPHIAQVSGERIGNELRWMLSHPNRHLAFDGLRQSGLLRQLLPQRTIDEAGGDQRLAQIGATLRQLDSDRFESALALIVYDLPIRGQVIDEVVRRLRLSNDESAALHWIVDHIDDVLEADRRAWPSVQRMLIHPWIELAVACAEAIAALRDESPPGIAFCRERLAWPADRLNPAPLIDGHDLQSLNIAPGPLIGEILNAVRVRQLSGEIIDRDQALEYARTLIR